MLFCPCYLFICGCDGFNDKRTKIDLSNVEWSYTSPFTYNAQEYSITLINLPNNITAEYSNNSAINAGQYTAVATLQYDDTLYKLTKLNISLTKIWEINKAEINLGNVQWDYQSTFTYDTTEKSVKLINLPDTVSAIYTNSKASNPGIYTASVQLIFDPQNYFIVNNNFNSTCDWAIIDETVQYKVSLFINNSLNTEFILFKNEYLTDDIINQKLQSKPNAYSVKKWYTNQEKTTIFYPSHISHSITLYGEWEYNIDNISFFPYLKKFSDAVNSQQLNILSDTELTAWFDYIIFYDITKEINFRLDYFGNNLSLTDKLSYVSNLCSTYAKQIDFQTISLWKIGCRASGLFFIYISESNINLEATLKADINKTSSIKKYESPIVINNTSPRNDKFDNFAINHNNKSLPNISTSEQLLRALQNGYTPICVSGSNAEKIFIKAKTILKNICNDNMTDYEKVRAIYEWLTINVDYDNQAYRLSEPNYDYNQIAWPDKWIQKWTKESLLPEKNPNGLTTDEYLNKMKEQKKSSALRQYDAWFIEGAINNQCAVCEGIAKAFVLLSTIEGIHSIVVVDEVHAWNKVLLNGNWYGLDATQGCHPCGTKAVIAYDNFLFTDDWKSHKATNLLNIICNTAYNFYESCTYDGVNNFVIDDKTKLNNILQYAKTKSYSATFSISFSSTLSYDLISSVCSTLNLTMQCSTLTDSNKMQIYVLILTKNS